MTHVVVLGAAGPVGRRTCRLAAADRAVDAVVAIDRVGPVELGDGVEWHVGDVASVDLDDALAGAGSVCHLVGWDPIEPVDPAGARALLDRVLDAAVRAGVGHVVVRTSATVYGAAANPVPLTEAAPVRHGSGPAWVRAQVAVEDGVAVFRAHHPEVSVTVLRPCVTVSDQGPDGLGRVLAAARWTATADDEPLAQFVHAGDVAAAVDLARRLRVDGVLNVAPTGWLEASTVRTLIGGAPSLPAPLPGPVARGVARLDRLAPPLQGFGPFATQPWVVANDRLRAAGWSASHSNEEALVASHRAPAGATITPRRRQELALGLSGAALVGLVGAGIAVLRRRLR